VVYLAENVDEYIKKQIGEAEENLKKAKALIDKLRKAGEDVSKLLSDYETARLRLERYKKAFLG
jgi:predicted  nucleic acid-binding Zn-ribbon protein